MRRINSGHYELVVKDGKYEVVKETSRVETGRSDKGANLVTWTPYLNGNQEPFGGESFGNYRGAREAVHAHVLKTLPDIY